MTLYLCGPTAQEFWLSEHSLIVNRNDAIESNVPHNATVREDELGQAHSMVGSPLFSKPLHALVPHAAQRRRQSELVQHVVTAQLPGGSFCRIAPNVCVTSPELTFVQAATSLSLPSLVRFGMGLTGRYRLPANPDEKLRYGSPHMSVNSLRAFLKAVGSVNGKQLAEKAVGFLVENSASPWESIVCELSCLPRRLGGYAISQPVLNPDLDASRQDISYNMFGRIGDLVWPAHRLVLEYCGSYHYESDEQRRLDDERRTRLEQDGWTVLVLTHRTVMSYSQFDAVMRNVAKITGKRIDKPTQRQFDKRLELRKELLY